IGDVRQFIDVHWARDHILGSSRLLLDWQHRNTDGYTFAVARRGDRDVLGLLGFIDTARFDPALSDDNVVWLTMWAVREDAGVAGPVLQLLHHVMRTVPHRAIGAIFPEPATAPIYRALRFRIGELSHYVRDAGPAASSAMTTRTLVTDDDFASLPWEDE